MKPFKIVITGASRPELWYADKIGHEFEVVNYEHTRRDGVFFRVRNDSEPFGIGFVLLDDCELAPKPAERNAVELAQLRRVAEAWYQWLENAPTVEIGTDAQKRFVNELRAWKAGKHGNS